MPFQTNSPPDKEGLGEVANSKLFNYSKGIILSNVDQIMESTLIPKITSSPSLVWVVCAIGFYIVNIFLGLFMAFRKRTAQSLKIHRLLFYTIVFCLGYYLIMNQTHDENGLLDYLICLYFITILPYSKRWDVLIHAFVGAIGLILLPLLIVLRI